MAAPIAGFIQLPLDTGNTGKKNRTQTRVVGADTVHEHFVVQSEPHNVVGRYLSHSGNFTVLAAAQNGTATGFLWIINLAASTIRSLLRNVLIRCYATTALATPTAPRLIGQLFTYTGTPSGATLTIGKADSTFPAAQTSFRTAMTGMTITLGAIVFSNPVPASMTAVGVGIPAVLDYKPDKAEQCLVLRTAEGVAFYQPDAGTTSDTRRINIDVNHEEIE